MSVWISFRERHCDVHCRRRQDEFVSPVVRSSVAGRIKAAAGRAETKASHQTTGGAQSFTIHPSEAELVRSVGQAVGCTRGIRRLVPAAVLGSEDGSLVGLY